MNHTVLIRFPGTQHCVGEMWVIRRVGEILGFETDASAMLIRNAVFAKCFSIEKIPAIALDAGLIGENIHRSTTGRF